MESQMECVEVFRRRETMAIHEYKIGWKLFVNGPDLKLKGWHLKAKYFSIMRYLIISCMITVAVIPFRLVCINDFDYYLVRFNVQFKIIYNCDG